MKQAADSKAIPEPSSSSIWSHEQLKKIAKAKQRQQKQQAKQQQKRLSKRKVPANRTQSKASRAGTNKANTKPELSERQKLKNQTFAKKAKQAPLSYARESLIRSDTHNRSFLDISSIQDDDYTQVFNVQPD